MGFMHLACHRFIAPGSLRFHPVAPCHLMTGNKPHRESVRLFSCPLHTETPETEVPHAFAQSSFQAR
jgi:hypothetical protein